jgi:hypothetical protein
MCYCFRGHDELGGRDGVIAASQQSTSTRWVDVSVIDLNIALYVCISLSMPFYIIMRMLYNVYYLRQMIRVENAVEAASATKGEIV